MVGNTSSSAVLSAEYWMYDTRLGRRWNLDPKPVVGVSDYATFANNPILFSDALGDSIIVDNKGKIVRNDNKDNNVYLFSASKYSSIGTLGGKIDVNNIFGNLLQQNKETAKNLDMVDWVLKVGPGQEWDYKANKNTIFGLAWGYDEDLKRDGKFTQNTSFAFGDMTFEDASDVGNYNAGYTGRFTYNGEGIGYVAQWFGAGAVETLKDASHLEVKNVLKQLNQIMKGNPPFGDEEDDFGWNTKGMKDADKQKVKDKKALILKVATGKSRNTINAATVKKDKTNVSIKK